MNNGEQLKFYGTQLQNFGTQVKNFGLQLQSLIGIQLESIGIQITNIGIQVFDIGNTLNQSQNNEMHMTQVIQRSSSTFFDSPPYQDFSFIDNKMMKKKSNKIVPYIYNISFLRVRNRLKTNIFCNGKTTIEELIKKYVKKVGLNNNDIYNNKIYFLYNGIKISTQDNIQIKDCLHNGCEIKVVDVKI